MTPSSNFSLFHFQLPNRIRWQLYIFYYLLYVRKREKYSKKNLCWDTPFFTFRQYCRHYKIIETSNIFWIGCRGPVAQGRDCKRYGCVFDAHSGKWSFTLYPVYGRMESTQGSIYPPYHMRYKASSYKARKSSRLQTV